jgi:hypothetical protein
MDASAQCRWCGKRYDQHLDYGTYRTEGAPQPRMPCSSLKAFFLLYEERHTMSEADDFKLDKKQRDAAHAALDRWIGDCEREAAHAWSTGRSGYLGRIKLCALVDDEGMSLRLESSLAEDL